MTRVVSLLKRAPLVVLVAMLGQVVPVEAQGASSVGPNGPRFLLASVSSGERVEIDVSSVPVFRRRVSLTIEEARLDQVLKLIGQQAGVLFSYDPRLEALERPVTVRADGLTLAATLTEVLFDSGLDVLVSDQRHLALVPRPAAPVPGSITGRVTEGRTGRGIEGAEVLLEGTLWRTLTGADGQYRIAEVDTGAHVVTARRIGYTKQSRSVVVAEGRETTADFELEKTATRLEELVTIGTIVPTEVRALPTPVSVITESDIARQRPETVQELLRQAIPTAVGWSIPANPQFTLLSARGASSFTTGSPQMKVFVDGVEVADHVFAAVDPGNVERIEVIRGPQASTIYGSNAIGGVIQVFTKRGDASLARPQVSAEAGVGIAQTPYASFDDVVRQHYAVSVDGGVADLSYHLGASYAHMDDWIPNGELSAESQPSVYGGMRFERGLVAVDVFGRYDNHDVANVQNPQLSKTGFVYWSKPFYSPFHTENQTLGTRLSVTPYRWWQAAVTVGIDRYTGKYDQRQPRLTTPGDTLLSTFDQADVKKSIAFNTSVHTPLGSEVVGSLTAGFDHYSFESDLFYTFGALNTAGAIQTVSDQPIAGVRNTTRNTGYFGQAQIGVRDALFVTAGLRAETNTNFGDSLGTPVSPRAGASYVVGVGEVVLKFRGAYGRAIRPPSPGFKGGSVSAATVVLPSPGLAPERQEGWDTGIDAVFGSRGSLSVTYYDQTAKNLIQLVQLQTDPVLTFQYQNVGRVKNRGVEVEGMIRVGVFEFKGQYGYTRSRIEQLAPGYTGELLPGDQSQFVPRHTAGLSSGISTKWGTTVGAGLSYVGSWEALDAIAFYSCLGGTGTCRPSFRDYTTTYPALVKVNANVTQRLAPFISGYIRVDNLTNNQRYERWNLSPVIGRVTTVGLRFRY